MRQTHWKLQLCQYLGEAARRPFEEGQHDCALFLANAVAAMTGVDFAAPYRGRYTTTRGGLRMLRKNGFADHVALAAHHLTEIAVARATPGDGAVVPDTYGLALGVVQGECIYVLTPTGLALVDLLRATRAFRVS